MPKNTTPKSHKASGLLRGQKPAKSSAISLLVVAALVVAVGGYWAVKHAAASGSPLCLNSASNLCIVSHGPYNQVTVQSSGYSLWTRINTKAAGENFVMFQNANGYCLRGANSVTHVVIGAVHCTNTDDNDLWTREGSSPPFRYRNFAWGQYMGTYALTSGKPVWVGYPNGGFYAGWKQ